MSRLIWVLATVIPSPGVRAADVRATQPFGSVEWADF